jgi:hypothetical protein
MQSKVFFRRLQLEGLRSRDRFRGDHAQIGFRRLVGLGALLLPVTERAERDAVAGRELLLGQPERARMTFTCGVRFIRLRSEAVSGRSVGSPAV